MKSLESFEQLKVALEHKFPEYTFAVNNRILMGTCITARSSSINGFKVAIGLPDGKSITLWMFSGLFDTLEFTISITYVEEKQGAKILDAWRKSTFD